MRPFHKHLMERNQELLDRMFQHPLIAGLRRGDLSEECEHRFAEQGYFFIRDYEKFLGALCANAPEPSRPCMTHLLLDLHQTVELFQEYTAEKLVLSRKLRMNRSTRSLTSFLHTTVQYRSFEEALAAWFAFYVVLSETLRSIPEPAKSPGTTKGRLPGSFLDEGFPDRLESLRRCVDITATNATPVAREKMEEAFRIAVHYVLRSNEAILQGSGF